MEKLRKQIFSGLRISSFALIMWELGKFIQENPDLGVAMVVLFLTMWYDG